jgi:hypothetical protein
MSLDINGGIYFMNAEIETKLVKRFPILYRSKYWPMNQTCMCWGFSCSDGWQHIIWMLSLALEEDLIKHYGWFKCKFPAQLEYLRDKYNEALRFIVRPPVVFPEKHWRDVLFFKLKSDFWLPAVTQVKEKFGTLRFYFDSNENSDKYINAARAASSRICETCGRWGELRNKTYWHYTSCVDHVQNWQDFTDWELQLEESARDRKAKMKKEWQNLVKKNKAALKKHKKGKKK